MKPSPIVLSLLLSLPASAADEEILVSRARPWGIDVFDTGAPPSAIGALTASGGVHSFTRADGDGFAYGVTTDGTLFRLDTFSDTTTVIGPGPLSSEYTHNPWGPGEEPWHPLYYDYPGFALVDRSGQTVWASGGSDLYEIDPDTDTWTRHTVGARIAPLAVSPAGATVTFLDATDYEVYLKAFDTASGQVSTLRDVTGEWPPLRPIGAADSRYLLVLSYAVETTGTTYPSSVLYRYDTFTGAFDHLVLEVTGEPSDLAIDAHTGVAYVVADGGIKAIAYRGALQQVDSYPYPLLERVDVSAGGVVFATYAVWPYNLVWWDRASGATGLVVLPTNSPEAGPSWGPRLYDLHVAEVPDCFDPSDHDDDGVGDGCDNCPFALDGSQVDRDGDGLGDACDDDIDGDGVPNTQDGCPTSHDPGQEDLDGDGIGDACELHDLRGLETFLDIRLEALAALIHLGDRFGPWPAPPTCRWCRTADGYEEVLAQARSDAEALLEETSDGRPITYEDVVVFLAMPERVTPEDAWSFLADRFPAAVGHDRAEPDPR